VYLLLVLVRTLCVSVLLVLTRSLRVSVLLILKDFVCIYVLVSLPHLLGACCRDSKVGIATRDGQDGPGIGSRWERDFPHSSRAALGPTQLPIQYVPGIFLEVKRLGSDVNHPPTSSAEVKERVEIRRYISGPSWPAVGRILYLYLHWFFVTVSWRVLVAAEEDGQ
jgi:hypothetical protein